VTPQFLAVRLAAAHPPRFSQHRLLLQQIDLSLQLLDLPDRGSHGISRNSATSLACGRMGRRICKEPHMNTVLCWNALLSRRDDSQSAPMLNGRNHVRGKHALRLIAFLRVSIALTPSVRIPLRHTLNHRSFSIEKQGKGMATFARRRFASGRMRKCTAPTYGDRGMTQSRGRNILTNSSHKSTNNPVLSFTTPIIPNPYSTAKILVTCSLAFLAGGCWPDSYYDGCSAQTIDNMAAMSGIERSAHLPR